MCSPLFLSYINFFGNYFAGSYHITANLTFLESSESLFSIGILYIIYCQRTLKSGYTSAKFGQETLEHTLNGLAEGRGNIRALPWEHRRHNPKLSSNDGQLCNDAINIP